MWKSGFPVIRSWGFLPSNFFPGLINADIKYKSYYHVSILTIYLPTYLRSVRRKKYFLVIITFCVNMFLTKMRKKKKTWTKGGKQKDLQEWKVKKWKISKCSGCK